ncbi:MAG: hypothetical protein HC902_04390 [Calothrix sp. SM1_5_4]|nr:hypothetical protein [Calothrix sp. SM1_5_4]
MAASGDQAATAGEATESGTGAGGHAGTSMPANARPGRTGNGGHSGTSNGVPVMDAGTIDPKRTLSPIEAAIANAFNKVCQRPSEMGVQAVGEVGKVAVFPLDSDSVPGYLVIGIEEDPNRVEDFS